MKRVSGKFLGQVVDNDDPKRLTRIRVTVPEVLGDTATGWCVPSSPYAGPNVGLAAVPPIGSMVFVEWPAGDTTRVPIWSGGMWADGDGVPGAAPDTLALVTPGGHRVLLRDTNGSEAVEIESASGAKITLDPDGVAITFSGQRVALTNSSISFNDGALEVQ
jgi:uncharacterized protein involved in type VI secretion and phage assembly